MYKTLSELSFKSLCMLYVFGMLMLNFQYLLSMPTQVTSAQSSGGGISSYTATLIGGETEGVSSETLCCNGIVLKFSSINPASPWILDGEALMVPLLSSSYDNGNEYSSGYNVLGTVIPSICLIPDNYCYSAEFIHQIRTIGTSEGQS